MQRIIDFEGRPPEALRTRAERLAIDLNQLASVLENATTVRTAGVISQSADGYTRSRHLHRGSCQRGGPGAAPGFVLSWSVIGPIQKIDTRLAADRLRRLLGAADVTNRDELGALAANVNRMNDELDRLYEALEAGQPAKSEFLANMSHELRTPLNATSGVLAGAAGAALRRREREAGRVPRRHPHVGQPLLALINDVLDLSKVEAGQVELDIAPFSLHEAPSAASRWWGTGDEEGVQVALHENGGSTSSRATSGGSGRSSSTCCRTP